MKRVGVLTLTLFFYAAAGASAGYITPDLDAQLSKLSDDDFISTIVMLPDQVDIEALSEELNGLHATRAYRHEMVIRALRQKAEDTQGDLISHLESGASSGQVREYRELWIANMIVVEAKRSFIEGLSNRSDVGDVYLDYEIENIEPISQNEAPERTTTSIEEGLERINAPTAWARGYTGAGRLVSNLDTGVDGNHPALASRWRGTHEPSEECWYDPVTGTNFPFDSWGHGTHTMGITCGYESSTDDHIGVAYEAEWIAAGVIDRVDIPTTIADAITAFQWTADPDGDPGTVDDVPDVSSNSWGISPIYHDTYLPDGPCDQMFWNVIDACEAAGVVVVFAAGNEGTSQPYAIRNPANRGVDPYNSFCVGAIDGSNYGNDPIASFSSRGPVPDECGSYTTKPEVCAPGVDVRSSYPGGGYYYMSGTSMACPHVAGAVAVLRQADPNATSEQIKYALMATAQDLGSSGEDNGYGWGLIDLNAALDTLGASGCWWTLTCEPNDPPVIIPEEGGSFSFDAHLTNHCDSTRFTDAWTMARLPGGFMYGPVLKYENIPFAPDQTRGVTGMTHYVPGGAPPGSYKYIVYFGDYPSSPEDSCYFNVYKQGGGSGGPYSVLILLSDYSTSEANNAIDALTADGRFTGVDVMDVQYSTPTFDDLLAYDVLMVWSDYQYANADALGDVLADYVDAGGAVVLSQFSFTSVWAMGGRMMSEYSPLGVGYNYFSPVSLGTYDTGHPIMLGVSTLSEGAYSVDAPVEPNAEVVAEWDDGNPCVAVNAQAPRVVALNMYFGSTYFQIGGDWEILLPNALAYAGDNSYMRLVGWDESLWAVIENDTRDVKSKVSAHITDSPATRPGLGIQVDSPEKKE
ncbi:MAG: S8 family serine peptidase [Candidatus Glassbacteria bacterium]